MTPKPIRFQSEEELNRKLREIEELKRNGLDTWGDAYVANEIRREKVRRSVR